MGNSLCGDVVSTKPNPLPTPLSAVDRTNHAAKGCLTAILRELSILTKESAWIVERRKQLELAASAVKDLLALPEPTE